MNRLKYIQNISKDEISFKRIYEAFYRRTIDFPYRLSWNLNKRKNEETISVFKNKHKGERCFIIANGPSLKKTNLNLLKKENTIGMNRIYLNKETMGFIPNYLVVFDVAVQLRQFSHEIEKVDTIKFLNWNGKRYFDEVKNTYFFRQSFKKEFSTNFSKRAHGGHSVTNVCLQLAYFLGFHEVILVGKDHYYAQRGVPGQLVYSDGKEENHYIKEYYKPGMVWRIPDYKGEELMYSLAKEAFEKDGREVLDATIDGKLEIFRKVNYYDLFN